MSNLCIIGNSDTVKLVDLHPPCDTKSGDEEEHMVDDEEKHEQNKGEKHVETDRDDSTTPEARKRKRESRGSNKQSWRVGDTCLCPYTVDGLLVCMYIWAI